MKIIKLDRKALEKSIFCQLSDYLFNADLCYMGIGKMSRDTTLLEELY